MIRWVCSLAVMLTLAGCGASADAIPTPTPVPVLTPSPIPPPATAPVAPAGETFTANYQAVLSQEDQVFADIGEGTLAGLQNAYNPAFQAADLATKGPQSPFDDVGYRELTATIDIQGDVQQMPIDYGTPALQTDIGKAQAAYQTLQAIGPELQTHGNP